MFCAYTFTLTSFFNPKDSIPLWGKLKTTHITKALHSELAVARESATPSWCLTGSKAEGGESFAAKRREGSRSTSIGGCWPRGAGGGLLEAGRPVWLVWLLWLVLRWKWGQSERRLWVSFQGWLLQGLQVRVSLSYMTWPLSVYSVSHYVHFPHVFLYFY